MHIIRSSSELTAVCDQPLDPELLSLLGGYAAALEEFGNDLEATIMIIAAGDTMAEAEQAYGETLVTEGQFAFVVEVASQHGQWIDVVRIIADDGSGLVLLIEQAAGADPELLQACQTALAEAAI